MAITRCSKYSSMVWYSDLLSGKRPSHRTSNCWWDCALSPDTDKAVFLWVPSPWFPDSEQTDASSTPSVEIIRNLALFWHILPAQDLHWTSWMSRKPSSASTALPGAAGSRLEHCPSCKLCQYGRLFRHSPPFSCGTPLERLIGLGSRGPACQLEKFPGPRHSVSVWGSFKWEILRQFGFKGTFRQIQLCTVNDWNLIMRSASEGVEILLNDSSTHLSRWGVPMIQGSLWSSRLQGCKDL